jgi:hypothetical protein
MTDICSVDILINTNINEFNSAIDELRCSLASMSYFLDTNIDIIYITKEGYIKDILYLNNSNLTFDKINAILYEKLNNNEFLLNYLESRINNIENTINIKKNTFEVEYAKD